MYPVLETERLRLRPWWETDLDAFAAFCADEKSRKFLGGTLTRADAWRSMAVITGHWALRSYGIWVIEDKATGQFAGYSGLWNPEGWPGPEITWSVCTAFRRRGYAVEAARRARAYAYDELKWPTAVSIIHPRQCALPACRRPCRRRTGEAHRIQGLAGGPLPPSGLGEKTLINRRRMICQ